MTTVHFVHNNKKRYVHSNLTCFDVNMPDYVIQRISDSHEHLRPVLRCGEIDPVIITIIDTLFYEGKYIAIYVWGKGDLQYSMYDAKVCNLLQETNYTRMQKK